MARQFQPPSAICWAMTCSANRSTRGSSIPNQQSTASSMPLTQVSLRLCERGQKLMPPSSQKPVSSSTWHARMACGWPGASPRLRQQHHGVSGRGPLGGCRCRPPSGRRRPAARAVARPKPVSATRPCSRRTVRSAAPLRSRSVCQRMAASPSSSHFKTGSVGMGTRIANALQLARDRHRDYRGSKDSIVSMILSLSPCAGLYFNAS